MTQTTPATDAAIVLQRIEDVLARHHRAGPNRDKHWCMCGHDYPCDAYTLAQQLRDAVEALEWYGDDIRNYDDGCPGVDEANWVPGADQYENLGWIMDNGDRARAALRRLAQGEGA